MPVTDGPGVPLTYGDGDATIVADALLVVLLVAAPVPVELLGLELAMTEEVDLGVLVVIAELLGLAVAL